MSTALAVEDYHLAVSGGDDAVQLQITAGEGACSYCLVSKSTLRSIAVDHMTKAGLPSDLEVDIVYPDDSPSSLDTSPEYFPLKKSK
jgi:Fe-S cluster biogenesis protein NfuA